MHILYKYRSRVAIKGLGNGCDHSFYFISNLHVTGFERKKLLLKHMSEIVGRKSLKQKTAFLCIFDQILK